MDGPVGGVRRCGRMTGRRGATWLLAICTGCGSTGAGDETQGSSGAATSGSSTGGEPTTGGAAETSGSEATGGSGATTVDPSAGPGSEATSDPTSDPTADPTEQPPGLVLPPADAKLDYQLGGAYPPPDGVGVVSRDRNDPPAAGLYSVCYVNGFQAQPDEAAFWLDEHPELVLRDGNDEPVIDVDWDEMLLDTSTPEKRAALAVIVGGWIAGCEQAGYQAVEIDNLDSYSRSLGLLDQDQAVAFMALLSAEAHARGLAIAQKNSTELLPRRAEMGTDFAVAEECNHYDECDDYIGTYGDGVLMIEYSDADFAKGCAAYPQMSIVRRDVELTLPGDAAYVYDGC